MIGRDDKELYDGLMQVRELCGDGFISYKDFINDEITQFRNLNAKLTKYEKIMKQEVEDLYTYANKRRNDKDDIVDDFEIEVSVYFYLDKKDPAYKEDDSDNIMTVISTTKYDLDWGFGDDNDHNTLPARQETAMEHDKHCATFHALYDHTALHYQELLMIGNFEHNIKLHIGYKQQEISNINSKGIH